MYKLLYVRTVNVRLESFQGRSRSVVAQSFMETEQAKKNRGPPWVRSPPHMANLQQLSVLPPIGRVDNESEFRFLSYFLLVRISPHDHPTQFVAADFPIHHSLGSRRPRFALPRKVVSEHSSNRHGPNETILVSSFQLVQSEHFSSFPVRSLRGLVTQSATWE